MRLLSLSKVFLHDHVHMYNTIIQIIINETANGGSEKYSIKSAESEYRMNEILEADPGDILSRG